MKFNPKVLLLALLIPLTAACSVATVDDSQSGVKVNKGKIVGCTGAGFKVASPFTKFKTYPKGVQHTDMLRAGNEGDKAGDDSIVVASTEGAQFAIDVTINYRVTSNCSQLEGLYRNGIKDTDSVKQILIRPAARSAVRDVFAGYKVREATTSKRAEIATKISKQLNDKLAAKPAQGAVSVDSVELRNFYLNPDLQAQVDQAIKLEAEAQQKEIIRRQQETEAETARIVAVKAAETAQVQVEAAAAQRKVQVEADANSVKVAAEAAADAKRASAQADADANRLLAGSLTPDLIKLRIAQMESDALKGAGKVIVGAGGGSPGGTIILDSRGQ